MKRITSLTFFFFIAIFSSSVILAANSEEDFEPIELREFIFDSESLTRVILLTSHSEEEILNTIIRLLGGFILHNQEVNMKELYSNSVFETKERSGCDLIKSISFATFAALWDSTIELQEGFDHGVMIQGHSVCAFIKLIFPKTT